MVRVPLATNTVVVNFEQLAANVLDTGGRRDPARHDVLGRHSRLREGRGGLRDVSDSAWRCTRSGELGIQLATMLHLGAVIPNLSFAADAHYHHLTDDIIEGGLMPYENGAIAVPDGPGLGVKLNREKLREYSELYQRLGGYPYDQDPGAARLDAH